MAVRRRDLGPGRPLYEFYEIQLSKINIKKTTIAKMSAIHECSSKSGARVLPRCWALHLPPRRRLKRGSKGNPVYTLIDSDKILQVDIERKSLYALTTLLRQGFQGRCIFDCL